MTDIDTLLNKFGGNYPQRRTLSPPLLHEVQSLQLLGIGSEPSVLVDNETEGWVTSKVTPFDPLLPFPGPHPNCWYYGLKCLHGL